MKLSQRLLTCAELVIPGNSAADVGTDHGFLAIYLLENGICPEVIASDLREKPLEAARRNALASSVGDRITFCLSDGLKNVPVERVRTVILAGMGGDLIASILTGGKSVWNPDYQFILQPQSGVYDLRRFLGENGFVIREERFASDGGFIYTVMDVRWGGGKPFSPAECFFPQGKADRESPLYARYMERTLESVKKTVAGLAQARHRDPEREAYFRQALGALKDWEDNNDNGK